MYYGFCTTGNFSICVCEYLVRLCCTDVLSCVSGVLQEAVRLAEGGSLSGRTTAR